MGDHRTPSLSGSWHNHLIFLTNWQQLYIFHRSSDVQHMFYFTFWLHYLQDISQKLAALYVSDLLTDAQHIFRKLFWLLFDLMLKSVLERRNFPHHPESECLSDSWTAHHLNALFDLQRTIYILPRS